MRLTRLEARDFAQHAQLDLDLTTFDQAVVVGENGAGKSTLMDAVVWCLYGRGTERAKATDSLIRDDRLGMWVRTTWDRGGEAVVVQRTRSVETKAGESSLALHVGGEARTQHTIGETQAIVERLVGLDREQLLAGPFMEQGEQDKLMRYDPAPRKALFASLCGADRFEGAHDIAKTWRDQHAGEAAALDGKIPAVRARVDRELALTRERDEAATKRASASDAVEALSGELEALRSEAESLRDQALRAEHLSERLVQLNREDAALLRDRERMATSLEASRTAAAVVVPEPVNDPEPVPVTAGDLGRYEANAVRVPTARREVARLEAEIEHSAAAHRKAIDEGLCDRCPYRGKELTPEESGAMRDRLQSGKDWLTEHEDDVVRASEIRERMGAYQRELDLVIAANAQRRAAYELSVERRDDAGAALIRATDDLVVVDARREAIADESATVQAERLRLIQTDDRAKEVASAMTQKAEQLTMARGFLSEAERAHAIAESALSDVAKARSELVDLERQRADLRTVVEAHDLVVKMFHRDGLPTMIVEATIPLVETRANELLERMPGEIAVALITQKQTKRGTWSDTLDVSVMEGGRERPYGMLSGAERFRVDLALRLGLASVLLHRSGSKFETLWLDEPFAAQDQRALESLLASVAAVVDEFGLTLVVTHQQEVAERFPVRIEVVDAGFGVARVEVAA